MDGDIHMFYGFKQEIYQCQGVSKLVVEKRKSTGKVKASEIMFELRMRYSRGITKEKTWRARNTSYEIIKEM